MPTEQQAVDAYTRRALQLVRAGNSANRDAARQLRALSAELRHLLAVVTPAELSRSELRTLLSEIDRVITARYDAMAADSIESMRDLVEIEAQWAQRALRLPRAPSASSVAAAVTGLTVVGLPIYRHWERQRAGMIDRVAGIVRTARSAGHDTPDLVRAVVGTGRQGRGGAMDTARAQAATLIQTSTHAAAYAGNQAAWAANGIQYVKWHAILDSRTTIGCAARAGKLYDAQTFEPVGHDIPLEALPPAHWNCRSILVAMAYPDGAMPDDGHDPYTETFDEWLQRHSEQDQNEMLGRGRAAAWRGGHITTRDLIGQGGRTLSLGELEAAGKLGTAYDKAQMGVRYSGFLEEREKYTTTQLRKSARSYKQTIDEHQSWIENPYLKVSSDADPQDIARWVNRKWPSDIARNRSYLEIVEGILRSRYGEP